MTPDSSVSGIDPTALIYGLAPDQDAVYESHPDVARRMPLMPAVIRSLLLDDPKCKCYMTTMAHSIVIDHLIAIRKFQLRREQKDPTLGSKDEVFKVSARLHENYRTRYRHLRYMLVSRVTREQALGKSIDQIVKEVRREIARKTVGIEAGEDEMNLEAEPASEENAAAAIDDFPTFDECEGNSDAALKVSVNPAREYG